LLLFGSSETEEECKRISSSKKVVAFQNERHGDARRGDRTVIIGGKRCSHGKRKDKCAQCSPCPHGKRKDRCAQCSPCLHGKLKDSCAACKAARAAPPSSKRVKREPESSPKIKLEPEIKQEPKIKQEPFTIRGYFGIGDEDEGD
jgi:hypothetical protein